MSGTPLSRRGVLRAAGLAGVPGLLGTSVLSGCDLDPESFSTPSAAPASDPDQHIVDAARAELRGLLMRLSVTSGTTSLVACHRRQLAALDGDPPAPGQGRPLTKANLVAREHRAAERFTRWAATCQNGDLARLLASVAAGIRMQPVLREAAARDSGAAP